MTLPIATEGLRACLEHALQVACSDGTPVLASYSARWEAADPIAFLEAGQRQICPCYYWSIPQDNICFVGIGCIYEVNPKKGQPWEELQDNWTRLIASSVIHGGHRPMLCGGFAFDSTHKPASIWTDFSYGALTLARFGLDRQDEGSRLVVNTLVNKQTDIQACIEDLNREWDNIILGQADRGAVTWNEPDIDLDIAPSVWVDKVDAAVQEIRNGRFRKVVLARSKSIRSRRSLKSILDDLEQVQPDAYVFAFVRGDSCFLGASPERLVRLKEQKLSTYALAGSSSRGGHGNMTKFKAKAFWPAVKTAMNTRWWWTG